MIFQRSEEIRLEIVYCPACGEYHGRTREANVMCGVAHAPGSCCHFGWSEIRPKDVDTLVAAFRDFVKPTARAGRA
jgi:hypothetical protein